MVVAAAEMVKQGLSAEEIVKNINELIPRVDASFVIDNLEYLYKGGRCSALAMFGANLLKLKPCIQVKDGKMDVRKKFRGKFDAVLREYIDEQLSDPDDRRRTVAALARRGYSYGAVKRCIEAALADEDFDPDEFED